MGFRTHSLLGENGHARICRVRSVRENPTLWSWTVSLREAGVSRGNLLNPQAVAHTHAAVLPNLLLCQERGIFRCILNQACLTQLEMLGESTSARRIAS